MSKRILIIDDDYSFAHYARLLVQKLGFEATMTTDSKESLELVRAQKPDLILVDAGMPDLDGIEIIRRLKKDSSTAKIPVLLCSITREKSQLSEAFHLGARDFIAKPLTLDKLKSHLDAALAA